MNIEIEKSRGRDSRAAIFVDYQNLAGLFARKTRRNGNIIEIITELLTELKLHLVHQRDTKAIMLKAYADFSELEGAGVNIQQALCRQGAEPRFVAATQQKHSSAIQLCVDVMEILHRRPDIDTFVVVSGDQTFLPLLQQILHNGRKVIFVGLGPLPSPVEFAFLEGCVFVEAEGLLSETTRNHLNNLRAEVVENAGSPSTRQRTEKVAHKEITGHAAYRALEIIEEHFGQYNEIYLTPLLRKLAEEFPDPTQDPKIFISELVEDGAIWLEKRQSSPHDYTVLLVDIEHPDVKEIKKTLQERNQLRATFGDMNLEENEVEVPVVEEKTETPAPNGKPKSNRRTQKTNKERKDPVTEP